MIIVKKLSKLQDIWVIVIGNPSDPENEFLLTKKSMQKLFMELKEVGFDGE
jgi:hypothetical protein